MAHSDRAAQTSHGSEQAQKNGRRLSHRSLCVRCKRTNLVKVCSEPGTFLPEMHSIAGEPAHASLLAKGKGMTSFASVSRGCSMLNACVHRGNVPSTA